MKLHRIISRPDNSRYHLDLYVHVILQAHLNFHLSRPIAYVLYDGARLKALQVQQLLGSAWKMHRRGPTTEKCVPTRSPRECTGRGTIVPSVLRSASSPTMFMSRPHRRQTPASPETPGAATAIHLNKIVLSTIASRIKEYKTLVVGICGHAGRGVDMDVATTHGEQCPP